MITAYRLTTGDDGHSHVERGSITSEIVIAAHSLSFKETVAHTVSGWHNAPVEQYVLTLSGVLEFTTHTGEEFLLRPGEVLVALDTTGTGHKWQLIDDAPWRRAYVAFKSGTDPQFVAAE